MSVTPEGGKPSRPAPAPSERVRTDAWPAPTRPSRRMAALSVGPSHLSVAGVVLLFLAPLVVAQDYEFTISPLADAIARPGREWDTPVALKHTCPATGQARMIVGGDGSVEGSANDGVWSDCRADGYSHATVTLHVRVLPTATAGVHGLAVGAFWSGQTATCDDGQRRSACALKVTVPYVATVKMTGPAESIVLPGRASEIALDVNITANGDTFLSFGTNAPEDWEVSGTQPVTVRVVNGSAHLVHRLRFEPPAGASGDVPITITALPLEGVAHQEVGAQGSHRWTARLPPKLQTDRPPSGTTSSGSVPGDVDVAPTAPDTSGDDGLPAWVIAAGLIGAAGLAFWWTRRKPS